MERAPRVRWAPRPIRPQAIDATTEGRTSATSCLGPRPAFGEGLDTPTLSPPQSAGAHLLSMGYRRLRGATERRDPRQKPARSMQLRPADWRSSASSFLFGIVAEPQRLGRPG